MRTLIARLTSARNQVTARIRAGAQLLPDALVEHQGVLGVATLSIGSGINWGPGWALIVISPFLLLAAWGSR